MSRTLAVRFYPTTRNYSLDLIFHQIFNYCACKCHTSDGQPCPSLTHMPRESLFSYFVRVRETFIISENYAYVVIS